MAANRPTGPTPADPDRLRAELQRCMNCRLYAAATQAVGGAGPVPAALMLIGEQPGDREDLAGEPFVGPAGQLLDRALKDADIERSGVYLTNAVKHFKFTARGKRRIHERPNAAEIRACRPWLDAELSMVAPSVLVTLGAVAAQALFGSGFRVTRDRGRVLEWEGRSVVPTVHPSAVLRARDAADRQEAYDGLVADLRLVADADGGSPAVASR
jgi:uracil-DNA glycosylase